MDEMVEDNRVDLEWVDDSQASITKSTLIGKLMVKKIYTSATIRPMLLKGWNLRKTVHISDLSNNMYMFSFEDGVDCNRVLQGRPWMLLGHLLQLQFWHSFLPLHDVQWILSPFWVQMHGIPIEGLSVKNGQLLGQKIGEVVGVEKPIVNGRLVRSFLRARVLVDVTRPLLEGIWVPRPNMCDLWISFKYEKLQTFCHTFS